MAARRIAGADALARRQNSVKEGAEGAEPQEEPTIALEQVNQQTLRITMLVMVALFGILFWQFGPIQLPCSVISIALRSGITTAPKRELRW